MSDWPREKRWLVIAEDGRHSTLGRATDPSLEEIARAGASLDAVDLAGWLVVSEGGYYQKSSISLLLVRRITGKDADWDEAQRLWHAARAQQLAER